MRAVCAARARWKGSEVAISLQRLGGLDAGDFILVLGVSIFKIPAKCAWCVLCSACAWSVVARRRRRHQSRLSELAPPRNALAKGWVFGCAFGDVGSRCNRFWRFRLRRVELPFFVHEHVFGYGKLGACGCCVAKYLLSAVGIVAAHFSEARLSIVCRNTYIHAESQRCRRRIKARVECFESLESGLIRELSSSVRRKLVFPSLRSEGGFFPSMVRKQAIAHTPERQADMRHVIVS